MPRQFVNLELSLGQQQKKQTEEGEEEPQDQYKDNKNNRII